MNGPNKLEHYITLVLKDLTGTNTLPYWTHLQVTNKMKCCEYGSSGRGTVVEPSPHHLKVEGLTKLPWE
jgi:hypothetical protein